MALPKAQPIQRPMATLKNGFVRPIFLPHPLRLSIEQNHLNRREQSKRRELNYNSVASVFSLLESSGSAFRAPSTLTAMLRRRRDDGATSLKGVFAGGKIRAQILEDSESCALRALAS